MKARALLRKELIDAFSGDDEMSLQASLQGLGQEEASWRLNDKTWTIDEIVFHVASGEIEYCRQGFGVTEGYERTVGDIAASLALLDRAQAVMLACLDGCTEADLDQPVATRFHGESAAHFIWIMVMHRVSHAAQIRTIRRAYGSRTHYYPV